MFSFEPHERDHHTKAAETEEEEMKSNNYKMWFLIIFISFKFEFLIHRTKPQVEIGDSSLKSSTTHKKKQAPRVLIFFSYTRVLPSSSREREPLSSSFQNNKKKVKVPLTRTHPINARSLNNLMQLFRLSSPLLSLRSFH